MKIITGHTGEPHIKPEQDRAVHQGLVGADSCILNVGNNLAAEVISANEIRILDGVLSHQGCFGIVETGTYDTLTIANGAQGMQRKDLIVCRYQKTGNIESLSFVVIQGTAVASNPAAPAYNTGLIATEDSPVDFPLYQVNLDGISITSVDPLASTVSALDAITALQNKVTELQNKVNNTKLTVVNASLGTLTFNSAGAAGGTINVAQYIPAGYTMIGAIPVVSGYFGAHFYTCLNDSATSVYVQLLRVSGTQATTSPMVKLICTKNL